MVLCFAAAVLAVNRRAETAGAPEPAARRRAELLETATAVLAIVLAALLFAGSLAAGDETWWWGLIAGAACGALGLLSVAQLFRRARARLDGQPDTRQARSLLDVYAEGIALALAALTLFVEPAGYVALAVFVFLIVRSRGEQTQKYGGLRILR